MKPNRPADDALNPSVWWFNGPGRGLGGRSFFFLRLAGWKLVEFDGSLEVQRWIVTDVGSLRTLLLCEKIGLIILHLKEWSIYMGYARRASVAKKIISNL